MQDAPTVDERYISATSASNMRVQAERASSADLIIAAGMNPARMGMALIRLASEWDGAIRNLRTETDLKLLAMRLKTLPAIRREFEARSLPMDKAMPVLLWWLYGTCQACLGRGQHVIPDTPALGQQCSHCRGTGQRRIPQGQWGRDLASWLDECRYAANQSLKKRLHQFHR